MGVLKLSQSYFLGEVALVNFSGDGGDDRVLQCRLDGSVDCCDR